MATTLIYNGVTFTDAEIVSGELIREKSPLSDSLSHDTLEVSIYDSSGSGNYSNFVRGTVADLYHDERYLGKYYIDSVDRNSKYEYTLHFISALGLLDKIPFKGGIYDRVSAGSIIASIMGGTYVSQDTEFEYYTGAIPFYIQKSLKNTIVTGWLRYLQSSKNALRHVLFAVGGSVLKADNGLLKFTFWQPTAATPISSERLYLGGSVNYPSKITKVQVTEHEFRQTSIDNQVELFDSQGVTVTNKLVVFGNPCYNLSSTTLTIHESNCNYAIVSGLGKLTGYEYTHNTMLIEKSTGVSGEESVATIEDNYLISSLNSLNVAERVSAFYGFANVVNYGMVVQGDVTVGDRVSFTDPFDQDVTAYIESEQINISGILKSQTKFITNWQPNHQGNQYNNFTILSSGSSWIVPTALRGTPARVVIFGGFEGGQGGKNGANGSAGNARYSNEGYGGAGGAGGKGGDAGYRVNINVIDIPSLGNSYYYTLGEGGNGGAIGGSMGSLGTDSVFNGISSASGTLNTLGWANPISGEIYNDSTIATNGYDGGNGGGGGDASGALNSAGNGGNGGDVLTHKGGVGGTKYEEIWRDEGYSWLGGGGGGGGASIDADGENGTSATGRYSAGRGGKGASVTSVLGQASLGQCGKGGSGGGGGGGGSLYIDTRSSYAPTDGGASGGTGQAGQKGSNGFILIMHN